MKTPAGWPLLLGVILATASHASECDNVFPWILESYRESRTDPLTHYRLGAYPDEHFGYVVSKTYRSLNEDELLLVQIHLGANLLKEVTNNSTVVIGQEIEREPGKLRSYYTITVYIPDPAGGYRVHQAHMDEDDDPIRRSFHADSIPRR